MVPLPTGNCRPLATNVAVAVPPDPVSGADPSEVPAIEKVIEPDGVVPSVEVTVAVKYTMSFAVTVLRLLRRVTCECGVTGVVLPPFQPITIL